MNANYRQLSLLYEFLNHTGQYLTYSMLCEQMNVSEKTIHNEYSGDQRYHPQE